MAASKPALTVILTPDAESELWEIWRRNLDRYSYDHAESYESFLKIGINRLATAYEEGDEVERFPELKSITLKRSRRGDGYIVIYEADEEDRSVIVFHIFHTKMDVQGRLESERL